jgi:hypothetical protein
MARAGRPRGATIGRLTEPSPGAPFWLRPGCIPVPRSAAFCKVVLSKYQPLRTSPHIPVLSYGACRPTRTWTA